MITQMALQVQYETMWQLLVNCKPHYSSAGLTSVPWDRMITTQQSNCEWSFFDKADSSDMICWNVEINFSPSIFNSLSHTEAEELILTFRFRFVLTSTTKLNALNRLSSFSQSMLEPLRLVSRLWGSNSMLFMMRQWPHGLASIL